MSQPANDLDRRRRARKILGYGPHCRLSEYEVAKALGEPTVTLEAECGCGVFEIYISAELSRKYRSGEFCLRCGGCQEHADPESMKEVKE